jgi:hypothetical protein
MLMTQDIASAGIAYVARGWAVVPLHDVSAGSCSCGSADPDHIWNQGGKHPIYDRWQLDPLRDPVRVREQWAARPMANIGIATGAVSGFWVLDVDPDHGGHIALTGLISAYGPLPETYTVLTGSGGQHYYFALPDWEVTASRGRLPVGLDVRGRGGQVVAPPSVSSKGAYQVGADQPVAPAPAWLLDLIRPRQAEGYSPVTKLEDGGPLAGGTDRARAYAAAAVRAELAELAQAQPGTRNETAFRVACRLAELVNATWAGLDGAEVAHWYHAAAEQANADGSFSYVEAASVLAKAVGRVAGKAAELPPAEHLGTRVGWGELPAGVADFSVAGQGPAPGPLTFADALRAGPLPMPGVTAEQLAADPYAGHVEAEAIKLAIRERGRALYDQRRSVPVDFDREAMTGADLAALPRPAALVDGWLTRDTLARVYGPSGAGKSFVVLDLGACVATGTPWHGRAVERAPVCYAVAEGLYGMGQRREAWQQRHQLDDGITYLPRAVQITGAEWAAYVDWCRRRAFGLIIIDTQARATEGVKENDNAEMGMVVARLDELRRATAACILLVHHKGSVGEHARGATAMRGAMDVEIDVTRLANTLRLRTTKVKDAAEAVPLELTLAPLGPSAVLVRDGESVGMASPFVAPVYGSGGRQAAAFASRVLALVEIMIDNFGEGNGGTEADIKALYCSHRELVELPAVVQRKAFRRAWNRLEELGRIARVRGLSRFKFVELADLGPLEPNPEKLVPEGWILAEPSLSRKTSRTPGGGGDDDD